MDTEVYPEQLITGWSSPVRSFPLHKDWPCSSVRVPVTAPLRSWGTKLFAFEKGERLGRFVPPTWGDKVGCWPGPSDKGEPCCPLCERRMEQVLQVSSSIAPKVSGCGEPLVDESKQWMAQGKLSSNCSLYTATVLLQMGTKMSPTSLLATFWYGTISRRLTSNHTRSPTCCPVAFN